MKKALFSLLAILLLPVDTYLNHPVDQLVPIPYIDFDASMQKDLFADFLQKNNNIAIYNMFKTLYSFTNPLRVLPGTELLIPKSIHFIWLGRPMPAEYEKYIQSWRDLYPDWPLKVWTESDVPTFNFKNKDMFDEATNYSRKADIWCLEILEQFGGLYLNIDFQALKRVDTLHYTYNFYIGMQPLDTGIVQIGTGLIASKPHHPFLQYAIEKIRENRYVKQIIVATGPVFFTRCYMSYLKEHGLHPRDIIFPASYFYPCGYTQRGQPAQVWYTDDVAQHAYAIHHWAGSWLGKEGFVPAQG